MFQFMFLASVSNRDKSTTKDSEEVISISSSCRFSALASYKACKMNAQEKQTYAQGRA